MSKKQDNFENKSLVFALTQNPLLGFLIEAFTVSENSRGQFEYDFKRVAKISSGDSFNEFPADKLELLNIIDKYSDENLLKRFSSKNKKLRDFYNSLEESYIKDHIRPFLDRAMYDAVNLMAAYNIPLFFKGETLERINEKPLRIPVPYAETFFHFKKLADRTEYLLQLKLEGNKIALHNSGGVLITTNPCLLLLKNTLIRFEPAWNGKKLLPFFEKPFLVAPGSSEKSFYEKFVAKTLLDYPCKAEGFKVIEASRKPRAVLKLEQHWQGNIALGLYFGYGDKTVFDSNDKTRSKVKFVHNWPDFHFEKVGRDFEAEKTYSDFLLSENFKRLDGPYFSLKQDKIASPSIGEITESEQVYAYVDWLNENHKLLKNMGFELHKEVQKKTFFTGITHLSFESEEKNDWFDLKGIVRFGTIEVPFIELKDNILSGKREFELPDGTIALIPVEWMSKYHDLFTFAQKKGDSLVVKKHHYTLLQSVKEEGLKIKLPDVNLLSEDTPLPQLLNARLREYQKSGYNWMMFLKENGMGGCLADDMGLGKTLQTLALLCRVHLEENPPETVVNTSIPLAESTQLYLFNEQKAQETVNVPTSYSLVVMPLSLIHNWIQEINRFAPALKVLQHTGTGRTTKPEDFYHYHLVLTTYGTLRNDVELLGKCNFEYIILDESQIIKNASSKIFSAIKKLNCNHRLVLSGTPVENSLTDLWSQFSFINPGMLGSLNFFKNEFVFPIEKKQDALAVDKLQKLIAPFILRRTKQQVAKELPPLTQKIHYCEMSPEQESYYESRKSEIRNAILAEMENRGEEKSRFMVLSGLTRLRLIANHPGIIDQDYLYSSGKYEEIIRSVEKLISENHKVLIFSQFVKHLNLFRDYFSAEGHDYSMLTGKMQEDQRRLVINRFQNDPENRLFLLSLKAGGVGLNLTGADYVFMLDPWWNPAVEQQAINRAHRIGQNKNVFVYKFITHNTVEEKILKLQEKKSNLAAMFVNENNPLSKLSMQELKELL